MPQRDRVNIRRTRVQGRETRGEVQGRGGEGGEDRGGPKKRNKPQKRRGGEEGESAIWKTGETLQWVVREKKR